MNLDHAIFNALSSSAVDLTSTDLAKRIDGHTLTEIRNALRNLSERGSIRRVVRARDAYRYSIPRQGALLIPAVQPTVDARTALLHDLYARGALTLRHYVAELSDGELLACPTSKLVSIIRDLSATLERSP
jgi:hypothetical protein